MHSALRNGTAGYVLKAADATQLLKAVRVAAAVSDPYDRLTPREREISNLRAYRVGR